MMLQRLATGATGVKQARYRRIGAARHSYAHAQYIHSLSSSVYHCVHGRSLALAVQCETTHGVYEFRRGFCTLVLSLSCVCVCVCVCVCLSVPNLVRWNQRTTILTAFL